MRGVLSAEPGVGTWPDPSLFPRTPQGSCLQSAPSRKQCLARTSTWALLIHFYLESCLFVYVCGCSEPEVQQVCFCLVALRDNPYSRKSHQASASYRRKRAFRSFGRLEGLVFCSSWNEFPSVLLYGFNTGKGRLCCM